MLIGIDASRATRPQRTGTENYSLHLLRHLLARGGGHRFRLYFNQPPPPDLFPGDDWEMRAIPLPRLWTHLRLSWEVTRHAPDVLFVPAHVIPLFHPARSVATIHDLGYLKYPQAHPRAQRLYLDWGTRWNARAARHLISDSQTTKLDLVMHYGVPAEKITVIYPGVHLSPASPREIARVRSRYRLPENYILFVGTLQPRKNLPTLFQAYRDLARHNGTDYQLVLAGKRGWLSDGVLRHIEALGLNDRVRLLDYVPSEDLPGLLGGSRLLVQP
ncbi:MAG: glycosyltransferase family 4 protein, partial [Chloroflexi bacterium]|nr:glycosyltransferase family 4 protein [Chloroflexota bacterium]